MKSCFLLLSLTACCFGATDGIEGQRQQHLQNRKHAMRVVSKSLTKATGTECPHGGAKFYGECGKATA